MKRLQGLASLVVLVGAAMAGSTTAATGRTVRAAGSEQFVPNAKIMATLRFTPGPLSVKQGETVTWENTTPGEPHTISVVAAGDVPSTIDDVFNCAICNTIQAAHFPNGFNNPPVPVVNAGGPGLDVPGDSLLLFPDASVSATISARAGSTLHYICAIHPWMQGTISVN
jgi:plastocyanin